eukprot:1194733-Prymnesium_polylepis.1
MGPRARARDDAAPGTDETTRQVAQRTHDHGVAARLDESLAGDDGASEGSGASAAYAGGRAGGKKG